MAGGRFAQKATGERSACYQNDVPPNTSFAFWPNYTWSGENRTLVESRQRQISYIVLPFCFDAATVEATKHLGGLVRCAFYITLSTSRQGSLLGKLTPCPSDDGREEPLSG